MLCEIFVTMRGTLTLVLGIVGVATSFQTPHVHVGRFTARRQASVNACSPDPSSPDAEEEARRKKIEKQLSLGASDTYVPPPSIAPALGGLAVIAALLYAKEFV